MICGECTRRKGSEEFYRSNQATCKECVKERSAARRRANPEQHRRYTETWRERERLRGALIEHVARVMAVRYPREFLEAVHDAEDSLGLDPGTCEDLFLRTT